MSVDDRFKRAVYMVRSGPPKPEATNEEKLKVYGLYKQASEGDNNTAQPWAVQFEARAKWDAWTANKGKSKEDAMREYAKLLDASDPGWEGSETMKAYK
jgi:diazepam-binding inhibitor (GABA receptor modulating acyl-CoA-binding protein)